VREVEALLEKAERSFVAADLLLDVDFAASRAYYGYFYVAEGLLLSEGLRYSPATARSWPSTVGTLPTRAASTAATTVSWAEPSSSGL
jgi:hypothetical protein